MACGDKYKHLVVTASGYTPENPGSTIPFFNVEVYPEWYVLATRLATEAHGRFVALGTIECQKTGGTGCGTDDASGGSYPRWNALVALNNRMTSRYEDLSDPSWTIDRDTARAEAQVVIDDAICLMEASDEGIAAYGGVVPVTPGGIGTAKGATGVPWWIWVGGGITLTLGGLALARKWSRDRRERSAPPADRYLPPRPRTPPDEFGSRLADSALSANRRGPR